MVQGRGDDALGPQALGHQLVHPQAGGQAVVAGPDPVVGGRGHDQTHPAGAAGPAADQLPAHERHGVRRGMEKGQDKVLVLEGPVWRFLETLQKQLSDFKVSRSLGLGLVTDPGPAARSDPGAEIPPIKYRFARVERNKRLSANQGLGSGRL